MAARRPAVGVVTRAGWALVAHALALAACGGGMELAGDAGDAPPDPTADAAAEDAAPDDDDARPESGDSPGDATPADDAARPESGDSPGDATPDGDDGALRPDALPPFCGNWILEPPGEECDDGNRMNGDGCDNDCRFSCHAAGDCASDDNPCTTELCVAEGTGRVCRSGPNGLPCEDGDPCTIGDACRLGSCTGGERLPRWWQDADGDGFGLSWGTVACGHERPAGFADNDDDCCDASADVFPGQPAWFAEPVPPECAGSAFCVCWDYDCTGMGTPDEREHTACGSCTLDAATGACTTVEGWLAADGDPCEIPWCGVVADWVAACDPLTCTPGIPVAVRQRCH